MLKDWDKQQQQNLSLSDLEFIDADFFEHKLSPSSNKFPGHLSQNITVEPQNSSTLNSLLEAHEDLTQRLQLTLKRMAYFENENFRLNSENQEQKTQIQGLGEKHKLTQDRLVQLKQRLLKTEQEIEFFRNRGQKHEEEFADLRAELHAEKQILIRNYQDQIRALEDSYTQEKLTLVSDYENQAIGLKKNLSILEKQQGLMARYIGRIRKYVKPLLCSLQSKVQSQSEEIHELQVALAKAEKHNQGLQNQMMQLIKNSREQVQNLDSDKLAITENYELQLSKATHENANLRQLIEELHKKYKHLDGIREKADLIENKNISLERQKQELERRRLLEIADLQSEMTKWRSRAQHYQVQMENALSAQTTTENQIENLRAANRDLESQLESLRLLWTEKNEENEKLKAGNFSLEKINSELSVKLQEQRNINTLRS